MTQMLSEQALADIDREIGKYPADQKQAALMATLTIAQRERGWISTELIDWIATLLDVPSVRVYEVATFYSMYDMDPSGRHKISVCTNVSCMLTGSDHIVEHLQKRLGIKLGETTKDGQYSLREVECLAACGGGPMMQIGDAYYENLTPARIDTILDDLESADA